MRDAIRRWWSRSWFHFTHCGEVGTGTGYTLNGRFHEARYYRCICTEAGQNWTDFSFAHTAEDFAPPSDAWLTQVPPGYQDQHKAEPK